MRDLDHISVGYLFEGKLVLDKTRGHGYYGCAGCCGYVQVDLNPNRFSGGINTGGYDVVDAGNTCTGGWDDMTAEAYNWGTDNTSIATLINAYNNLVGLGSTTGYATVQVLSPVCRQVIHYPQNGVNSSPSISWNGKMVNNTTQNAVVGEQISLDGNPAGGSWSIGGNAVAGFTTGTSGGPQTLINTSGQTVLFYWVVGGTNKVTHTMLGQSASITFNVAAPSAANIAATGSNVIITSSSPHSLPRLQLGHYPSTPPGAEKKDTWGIPVLRIHSSYGENEQAMAKAMRQDVGEILDAIKVKNPIPPSEELSIFGKNIHECGTARMGIDPKKSVLNRQTSRPRTRPLDFSFF